MLIPDDRGNFLRYLRLEIGAASNTVSAYRSDLRIIADAWGSEAPELQHIHADDITALIHALAERGDGTTTINRRLAALRSYCMYLVRERLIPRSRITEHDFRLKEPETLPEVLSQQEAERMLCLPDSPYPLRDRLIVAMLYASGARASEVCDLDLDDISGDRQTVMLHGKGDKSRLVPIDRETGRWIDQYLEKERPRLVIKAKGHAGSLPLFLGNRGGRITRQLVHYVVKHAAALAGVFRPVSAHTLRHSFATHILQNGGDIRAISALLGHEQLTTTQMYTHLDTTRLRKIFLAHHPRAYHTEPQL